MPARNIFSALFFFRAGNGPNYRGGIWPQRTKTQENIPLARRLAEYRPRFRAQSGTRNIDAEYWKTNECWGMDAFDDVVLQHLIISWGVTALLTQWRSQSGRGPASKWPRPL